MTIPWEYSTQYLHIFICIFAGFEGKLFERINQLRIFLSGLCLAALGVRILLGLVIFYPHARLVIFFITALAVIIPSGVPGEARAILACFPMDDSTKHQVFIYDSISWLARGL